jgi:hypothetical protein
VTALFGEAAAPAELNREMSRASCDSGIESDQCFKLMIACVTQPNVTNIISIEMP